MLKIRKIHLYNLSHISNADQTLLTFDMTNWRTIDEKYCKSFIVRKTRHDLSLFTIMFECAADGRNFPRYLVFKRKTIPKQIFLNV